MDEDEVCEMLQKLKDNLITKMVLKRESPQSGQIDALLLGLLTNSSVELLTLDLDGCALDEKQTVCLQYLLKKKPHLRIVDFSLPVKTA